MIELILGIVVTILLILTVWVCLKPTNGTAAITALKSHLSSLQLRLTTPLAVSAENERSGMESLFNKVKGSCEQNIISSDKELASTLRGVYEQISFIRDKESDKDTNCSWLKLKNTVSGFKDTYFVTS